MTKLELHLITEAFGALLGVAGELTALAMQAVSDDRKEAVERTDALLHQVKDSLSSWKGPKHVD